MRDCPKCGSNDIIMVSGQYTCARCETVVPDADLAPVVQSTTVKKELPSHVQIEEKTAKFLDVLKVREPGLSTWRETRHKLGSELHEMLGAVLDKDQYVVGQQVAPGLVVAHENTLKLLQEQADAKNDLRAELHKQDEAVKERDKVLVEADSHLSAIVHRYSNRLPDDFVKDIAETLGKVQKYSRP